MKKVRIFGLFGVCRNGEELAEGYQQPLSMGEGAVRMLAAIKHLKRLSLPFLLMALCGCALDVNGTGPIPDAPLPTTVTDAGAKLEAAALPPNGDQAQVAVCHSASGPEVLTRAECPNGIIGYDLNGGVAYVTENPGGGCVSRPVPVECSTCDYTCDCLLRYTELPDAGCTCSQNATGGVIIISGC